MYTQTCMHVRVFLCHIHTHTHTYIDLDINSFIHTQFCVNFSLSSIEQNAWGLNFLEGDLKALR